MSWSYPTPIGVFSTTTIIDYYDRPLSFIAKDTQGSKYFGYLIDGDHQFDTYLFTPVSDKRINDLLNGDISIRDALVQSENGWAYEAKYVSRDSDLEDSWNIRNSSELRDDEIPDDDVFFSREDIYKE